MVYGSLTSFSGNEFVGNITIHPTYHPFQHGFEQLIGQTALHRMVEGGKWGKEMLGLRQFPGSRISPYAHLKGFEDRHKTSINGLAALIPSSSFTGASQSAVFVPSAWDIWRLVISSSVMTSPCRLKIPVAISIPQLWI